MGCDLLYVSCISVELCILALSYCRAVLWPVMCMLDRIFEPSVTGSEVWSYTSSNKRVKSSYRARARLHTDQDDLRPGQPVYESNAYRSHSHCRQLAKSHSQLALQTRKTHSNTRILAHSNFYHKHTNSSYAIAHRTLLLCETVCRSRLSCM